VSLVCLKGERAKCDSNLDAISPYLLLLFLFHFFSFSSSGILQSSGTNWKTKLWFDLKGESAACGFYQVSLCCVVPLRLFRETDEERKEKL
jgi:hypothetical protein